MKQIELQLIKNQINNSPDNSETLTGGQITPFIRGLPKKTLSICPECRAIITAIEYEANGQVLMTKECSKHGKFNDIISSDIRIFHELERWFFSDGKGFSNPQVDNATKCPTDCGICNLHLTHSLCGIVDITTKCNLSCNFCFANAKDNAYEPTFNEVFLMLKKLREQKPVPCSTVQYSGGEPTIHKNFFEIIKASKDLGFTHIQVATNGIKFAEEGFAEASRDAGLQYLYLQMDGVTDDVFQKMRGTKLLKIKLKAIENSKKAGLRIIFVPTIVKGINDHQIGDLIRLAFENLDVVTGISVQPVCFTGRLPEAYRMKNRYTISDFILDASRQTGLMDPYNDWFSTNVARPFIELAESMTGDPVCNYSCHPHCGAMSLLFVDKNKNAVPVTKFLDLFNALKDIQLLASKTKNKRFKISSKIQMLNLFRKYFKSENAPDGLTLVKFLETLDGYKDKKYTWTDKYKNHTYKTFFIFGMHFMDSYNYDLQRVRRCGIHYSAIDGNIYPFCTYNSGYTFRNNVEKNAFKNKNR